MCDLCVNTQAGNRPRPTGYGQNYSFGEVYIKVADTSSGPCFHRRSVWEAPIRLWSCVFRYGHSCLLMEEDGRDIQGQSGVCGACWCGWLHASWCECARFIAVMSNSSYFQGRICIYELLAEESAVNYWEVCLTFVSTSTLVQVLDRNTAKLPLTRRKKPSLPHVSSGINRASASLPQGLRRLSHIEAPGASQTRVRETKRLRKDSSAAVSLSPSAAIWLGSRVWSWVTLSSADLANFWCFIFNFCCDFPICYVVLYMVWTYSVVLFVRPFFV